MCALRVCEACAAIFDEPIDACPVDGTPLEEARDQRVGTTIGRYVLVRRIGKGVRGYVYLGVHPVIRSRVAIKILHSPADEESDAYKRFVIEAQAVNQIQHPNIIRVMDMAILADKRPYILMEYVDGESLREKMLEGQLDPDAAYRVIHQILSGLQAAHDANFIHRDLKPRNIIVSTTGEAKILDFGIAKLIRDDRTPITEAGVLLGTPMYIAPEQALGKRELIGPWTDLYSVGIILYELYTGAQPFDAKTTASVLLSHVSAPPVPPSERHPAITPAMEDLILWCLEKDPADRPQTSVDLIEALEEARYGYAAALTASQSGSTLPAVDAAVDETFESQSGSAARSMGVRGDPTDPSYRSRPKPGPRSPGGSKRLDLDGLMRGSGRNDTKRRWRQHLLVGLGLVGLLGATLGALYLYRYKSDTPLSARLARDPSSAAANADPSAASREAKGRLYVVHSRRVSTVDPCLAADGGSVTLVQQTHEALVRYDNLTGQIQPWLALWWKRSPGQVDFRLRADVVFHDGAALTAEAAAASLRRTIASPMGKAFLWDIRSVDATGPLTFRVHLAESSVSFLMRLALYTAFVSKPGATHPVGTGPLKLKSWSRRVGAAILVPHSRYWGEVPRMSSVVFTSQPDVEARATMITQGTAHVLPDVPASLAERLRRVRSVEVLRSPGHSMSYLYYNTKKPYLRSPAIRRALSMAIDRERFVKLLYKGHARVARTSLPAGLGQSIRRAGWPAHDPAKAKRRVAGRPVTRRRLLLYLTQDAKSVMPDPKLAAKLLLHDLAAVGIRVNAVFLPFRKLIRVLARGDHDLAYLGWVPDYPDPENIYLMATRRGLTAGANTAHFVDADLERLVQFAKIEQNADKRQVLFERIERVIAQKHPWLPIAQLPSFLVLRKEVKGLRYGLSLNAEFSLGRTTLENRTPTAPTSPP